jgi:hypothetical protein
MENQMDWFNTDEEFKNLEPGFYTAKVTNVTLDTTKDAPRITVEFLIPSEKRKTWLHLRMKENSKKFFNWQVSELGAYDRAKELATKGKVLHECFFDALVEKMGETYEIEIANNEWQGKTYQNVKVSGMSSGAKPKTNFNEPKFDKDEKLPF